MEILKQTDDQGLILNPKLNCKFVIRCPGLGKAVSDYYTDFPWLSQELAIPDHGLVSFIALEDYYHEDCELIYKELGGEINTLIQEINACQDDDSGGYTYLPQQYKNVYFDLGDPVKSEIQIGYISKIRNSIEEGLSNVAIDPVAITVNAVKGDYLVITPA
jgi:hypothetical protein